MVKRLITYELSEPEQEYTDLHEAIESLGDWIHPMKSVWFVETDMSSADVRDNLKEHLSNNDTLFVCSASGWASSRMDGADWLIRKYSEKSC